MVKGAESGVLTSVERRLSTEFEAALSAKSADDGRLAGLLRVLAPHSAALRTAAVAWAKELIRLEAFDRELYAACLRALAESEDKRLAAVLSAALKTDDFGGLATLSVACFVKDASVGPSLARAASSSRTLTAFAAEAARLCHGDSTGPRLFSLAPRIKEAHRISLVFDLLIPISARGASTKACAGLADALHVLCGSERHLGRWLVMAEIAHRGGDARPLREAIEKTQTGPDSARAGWTLCAWALSPELGGKGVRPTTELVARLSHRPSADKDASFLFRMADRHLVEARPMLEALVRAKPLGDEIAVRAAAALISGYGAPAPAREALETYKSSPREAVRGLSLAALWDLAVEDKSTRDVIASEASRLVDAEDVVAQAWASLVTLSSRGKLAQPVMSDVNFRRIQLGWSE